MATTGNHDSGDTAHERAIVVNKLQNSQIILEGQPMIAVRA
jgi:hypothetical protein